MTLIMLLFKIGVYIHKEGKGLEYHAVKILGWGVENDGTPFWTVANPWSKRWVNYFTRMTISSD